MGVWYLSWQHAKRERVQTTILIACAAVSLALPLLTAVIFDRYDTALRARARETPLLLGPDGNELDLTLAALYFRESELPPLPRAAWTELSAAQKGLAIPLNCRFRARKRPIVGTTPEYFELRGLEPSQGSRPLLLGEAALGADLAAELGLGIGDTLFSDPIDLYDISKPASLKMQIVGVFGPRGGPDDDAVFVTAQTTWVLEGQFHGHDDAETLDENLILGRDERSVDISGAMIEYNEITPENLESFHFHGDPETLPISSVLFVPDSHKSETILHARYDAHADWQMVRPPEVIDELMSMVLRVKDLLDGLAIVIGSTTALLTALVILLGLRLRRREIRTFHHLGAGPRFVLRLYATEIGLILLLAAVLAAGATGSVLALLPDLVRTL